ncbi:PIN domain-containing protein [Leptolyngbya sp. FACHB-671]|uniref:type II toxin-antitoxin system VapC family toxin n=1 Tax=Leptolyngbya sp. FACHB-671 TaxID=2692812 RepID=UPI00168943DD|nr:PIN domain-containing protein [Leptolyngbya sp. FACHB-671]MBD2066180.1 PIN domain-containing protein [Leptolyngbya sp. FACHB-671]
MANYMFDTNIFNEILDGDINLSFLPSDNTCLVTHVQFGEIQRTKNPERLSQLTSIFNAMSSIEVHTESFVPGISIPGRAKASNPEKFYEIKNHLDELNKGKKNNVEDVLIAETAIINTHVLVTCDKDLLKVVTELGGAALTLDQFIDAVSKGNR